MSEIKNGGLDQYGAEPCKRQQFGTAGVEGVKTFVQHVLDVRNDRGNGNPMGMGIPWELDKHGVNCVNGNGKRPG